jgi:hypothetical protein
VGFNLDNYILHIEEIVEIAEHINIYISELFELDHEMTQEKMQAYLPVALSLYAKVQTDGF